MEKKDYLKELTPCSTLMAEDQYWSLIADSLKLAKASEGQDEYLIQRLKELSPVDIIGFDLTTDDLTNRIYTSTMWCAGYLMNEGCSDDGFIDFRNWVVSRGKDVYYKAAEDADTLISQTKIMDDDDIPGFEEFGYVASEAFKIKTGADIEDYVDSPIVYNQDIDFDWDDDEPETMQAICPLLYDYYWEE